MVQSSIPLIYYTVFVAMHSAKVLITAGAFVVFQIQRSLAIRWCWGSHVQEEAVCGRTACPFPVLRCDLCRRSCLWWADDTPFQVHILISSSTVHHSCSVVGEFIGVKNFHQVLCATDRQSCCVSFCLLPFVCRDTKPAYHGILLVLVEALESFWGRWSVAAHPIQGLAVCSNLFLMLALLMHCKVYRTGSRAFRYVEPDKHFCWLQF